MTFLQNRPNHISIWALLRRQYRSGIKGFKKEQMHALTSKATKINRSKRTGETIEVKVKAS